jgi:PKD repeat protein
MQGSTSSRVSPEHGSSSGFRHGSGRPLWRWAVGAAASVLLLPLSAFAETPVAQARVNLEADPAGRVVDVFFDRDLDVSAPLDRFRFAIDSVQPLTRNAGGFLGDLDGDGVRDLFLASYSGELLFFPGLPGEQARFGPGTYLHHTTSDPSEDPYFFTAGSFVSGDVGDLDGDGVPEVVIGRDVYTNVGTPAEPELQLVYTFPAFGGGSDPSASLGDLNGDGLLDVVITYNYALGDAHVFWNDSTPGNFSFSHQTLGHFAYPPDNRLAVADVNGDGLLDLAGAAGYYVNTGTAASPFWDLSHLTPWTVLGGPGPWHATNALGTDVYLADGDGDGLLDAYVSGLDGTIWQVVYYRNVGTPAAPVLQYVGPVTAASSPTSIAYRGASTPTSSTQRAFVAAGDIDADGRSEIALSADPTAILWNRAQSPASLAYPDLYTWPPKQFMLQGEACGVPPWQPSDALCRTPHDFAAWVDIDGDGLPDLLRGFFGGGEGSFDVLPRSGVWPFALGDPQPLLVAGTNTPVRGFGAAIVDVDLDGNPDLVTGANDGTLRYYRNLATSGFVFAAPVPLTDGSGSPIDVGDQSWPTAIDLDGDDVPDFLVANEAGQIRQVFCENPGAPDGYAMGDLLGTPEQDPVDVTHVEGEGAVAPSLATVDVDGDGLDDVVMGDADGRVWLLKNTGTPGLPSFDLGPLSVSRTSAAYLELVGARSVRAHFALPVEAGRTTLSFYQVGTTGEPVSGEVTVGNFEVLTASASADPPEGQAPLTVHFEPGASGGILPYAFDWDFGDGSADSNEQSPDHTFTEGGTFDVTVTVTDALGAQVSSSTAVATTPPCVIECSAAVPGNATLGDSVVFVGSATSSNCADPVAFGWDFGDGDGAEDEQSPTHAYSSRGVATWTMTATSGTTTCTQTGNITVLPGEIVPNSLNTPGLFGSQWGFDMKLYNPTDDTIEGEFVNTPRGASMGPDDPALPYSIPPHQVLVMDDFYSLVHPEGSGADRVLVTVTAGSAPPLVEGVMKSVLSDGGEYSQSPTVVETTKLWPAGTELAAILGKDGERDSPYIMTGPDGVTIDYTYRDSSGGNLTTVTKKYGPDKTLQHTGGVKEILGFQPTANASLEATITAGSAWIALAHINNTTNAPRWFDFAVVPPAGSTTPRVDQIVPVVLNLDGYFGSHWVSDLKFYNPTATAVTGTLTFTPRGASQGASDPSMPFTVGPNEVLVMEDVYGLAHPDASGADRVLIAMDDDPSTSEPFPNPVVEAVMRSVLEDGGEYGMSPTVIKTDSLLGPGATVAAILGKAGERDSAYVMTGPDGVTIQYTYRDATGGSSTVVSKTYGRNKTFQHTGGLKEIFGFTPDPNGSLEATITAGSAWLAVTHINNMTNAPRWFDCRPLP